MAGFACLRVGKLSKAQQRPSWLAGHGPPPGGARGPSPGPTPHIFGVDRRQGRGHVNPALFPVVRQLFDAIAFLICIVVNYADGVAD